VLSWTDEGVSCASTDRAFSRDLLAPNDAGIPTREKFAFCLNTILCDLAARLPTERALIVHVQLAVLDEWSADVLADARREGMLIAEKSRHFEFAHFPENH